MLWIAYSIFLANLVFGILVKRGVVDNRRFRFVHHGLYVLVIASLVAVVVVAVVNGDGRGIWPPAAIALLLLGMPLFRGRSRGHWVYATFCSVVYSAVILWIGGDR